MSRVATAMREKPALAAGAVVAVLLLLVAAWPAVAHWMSGGTLNTAWAAEADALGLEAAASLGAQASQQPEIISEGIAPAVGYLNPFRDVDGLNPERIDQGVDFSGSGPVYAIGDGVVVAANADYPGWDGGWVTYELTDGPASGLIVYVAEDITPSVQAGQQVTPFTVIGNMFNGSEGIETGWAQPTGLNAESQLPAAGGIGGGGPFPTMVGLDMEELLQFLGVPAANNRSIPANGLLPANYPSTWG